MSVGERLVEELAPELAPMLSSLEMPANFVPVTNAVFAEMARRGIGRQQILTALRKMGTELPPESLELIQVGLGSKAKDVGGSDYCVDVCVLRAAD